MSGDRAIRAATAAVVTAVAAFAAVVSFSHIYDLGRVHGQSGTAARLLPLAVDGLILAASLVLLHEARNGRPAPALARFALWLGVGGTIAANGAYGWPYGPVGVVLSTWPGASFVIAVEMLMGLVRRSRAVPSLVREEQFRAPSLPVPETAPALNGRAHPERAPARRAQSRSRVPVTPERAELAFATVLAEGRIPSLREVRRELHVGTDRARVLRGHLESALTRT
jgi:Protein of unknown function (DUF2637)